MNMQYRGILFDDSPIGPYPLHKLKRVDKPTNRYVGETAQRSMEESAFARAGNGEYGPVAQKNWLNFNNREPLFDGISQFQLYLAKYGLPDVAPEKAPVPTDPKILSRHIKLFGYFLGADMVGICPLPQAAVYSKDLTGEPQELPLKNAIVFLNVKRTETTLATYGNEWIDDLISYQSYQRCAGQAQVVAGYIRKLGYPAESAVLRKYPVLLPRLVIESGLGEVGRLGIAVNPFVGAAFKVSAVLTDLPLVPDKPIDFGLQDYCSNCMICADHCPTRSISDREKEVYNGYETWPINYKSCVTAVLTRETGGICQRCTKVCPWNRRDNKPEDFRGWNGDLKFLYDSVERQKQHLIKHNYVEPEELTNKWWFPLMEKDGKYVEAPEFDYENHEKFMSRLEQRKSSKTETAK